MSDDSTLPAVTVATVPPVVRECQALRQALGVARAALLEIELAGSAEYARRRAERALDAIGRFPGDPAQQS